jgi:hypothetical protein
MNTGQSLFSIGALLMLSLTVLRVNNTILSSDVVMRDSKLGILAVSLGTSLIEEANKKAFDAVTADDGITDVSLLTSPSGLGPAFGELPADFNDFDDYNKYVKLDTIFTMINIGSTTIIDTNRYVIFKDSCAVCYVEPTNIDGKIMAKTWHKKMTVFISSPSMIDTIKISKVFSYWNFR